MEMKTSLSSTQPVGFHVLPVEMRRLIYQYCLVRKDPFIIPDRLIGLERLSQCRIRDPKNSFLLVSKKVGAEALEVLYGDNTFQISILRDGVCHLGGQFWEVNRQRIRKLQIVVQPFSRASFLIPKPDSTFWSPLLAQLTKLTIVVPQSPQARLGIWTEWLRWTLQYFSSKLRSSCVVEVDDNDETETSALMKECFPRGYRQVQTLAGNLLFQGFRYYTDPDYCSGGSDYWNQNIPTWFGERHPPCITGLIHPERMIRRAARMIE